MKTKDKVSRIVARNPELKETFISLGNERTRELFKKILSQKYNKLVIVGKNAEEIVRLYELSYIMNNGYPHITELTTLDLLDIYTNRETEQGEDQPSSLSSVVDDLVLIKDSRAYLPNKQKTNMIMQVLEQNEHCIYYYKGSYKLFLEEHSSLLEYLKENSIVKLNADSNKQVYDGTSNKYKEEVI